MMVKVLLYGYCTGVYSSRKMARQLEDSVAFRFLAAGNQPDFRTLSDFRKRHGTALAGLFEQGLRLCRKAGLVQLGRVAIDGTKLKANASKHKAMSYGRMQEKEAALHQEVAELLRRAEQADRDEDQRYGAAHRRPKPRWRRKRASGRRPRARIRPRVRHPRRRNTTLPIPRRRFRRPATGSSRATTPRPPSMPTRRLSWPSM
jgi:hypothetical protein